MRSVLLPLNWHCSLNKPLTQTNYYSIGVGIIISRNSGAWWFEIKMGNSRCCSMASSASLLDTGREPTLCNGWLHYMKISNLTEQEFCACKGANGGFLELLEVSDKPFKEIIPSIKPNRESPQVQLVLLTLSTMYRSFLRHSS